MAGLTPPPDDDSAQRPGFYIVRFEYVRDPGVLATGIATVPKEAVGEWDLAVFYTIVFDARGMANVDGFILNSKAPAERQSILQALEKSASWLVFKTGELAEVDEVYKKPLQHMMLLSGPIFDEHAILRAVSEAVVTHLPFHAL